MILVFAGFCFLYLRIYVAPKPHGIIVFIVPGLNLETLHKACEARSSEIKNQSLPFFRAKTTLVHTFSVTPAPQDPASLLSLLSTNSPTLANHIGLDTSLSPTDNLFYKAQRAGRMIGLVSNCSLLEPENAAFYAHTEDSSNQMQIAKQLFDSTTINIILGSASTNLRNVEDRNLLEEAKLSGYRYVVDKDTLMDTPRWRTRKLLGLFPKTSSPEASLSDQVQVAIECLQYHLGGYFLIVTHTANKSRNGCRKGHLNVRSVQEIEDAIDTAKNFAGEKALVLLYVPYTTTFQRAQHSEEEIISFPDAENPTGLGWAVLFQDSHEFPGFQTPCDLHQLIERNL
ncbi:MAG: alkaline phosphatase [Verrucomicrobiota bacterium]